MVFVDPAGRAACPHAAVAGVLRYGCLRRVGNNAPCQFCNPITKTNARRREDTPPCRNAFKRAGNAACAAFSGDRRGGGNYCKQTLHARHLRVLAASAADVVEVRCHAVREGMYSLPPDGVGCSCFLRQQKTNGRNRGVPLRFVKSFNLIFKRCVWHFALAFNHSAQAAQKNTNALYQKSAASC